MDWLAVYFAGVEDPRASNARHDFLEVIFVALAALLCGAEDCTDMAMFAHEKLPLLRQVVELKHGAPSHDTFSRVFRLIDPDAFEAAFARFTAAFGEALKGIVAIDGKALRGAYEVGCKTSPLHLINVWSARSGLVIGQHLAPGRNEVQGVLEALKLLKLKGCTVTTDALHCRADTAQAILDTGADYVLAVKANQPTLLARAQALTQAASPLQQVTVEEPRRAHDRIEARTATITPASDIDFPGIAAVGRVEARRRTKDGAVEVAVRWYLLSTKLEPERFLEAARTHWTIENRLHWVLDVDLHEDAAKNRKDFGPQNLAIMRKIALNLLRQHPDKGSIKGKIKRAGWTESFLLSLLGQMR